MEHYEVWLDKNYIYVRNEQGDVASKPIARYERLHKASDEQRNAFELSSCGVHWYDLDIDNLHGVYNINDYAFRRGNNAKRASAYQDLPNSE